MGQHDTLLTLAEIAATFVGFSTIVVVFRAAGSEQKRLQLLDVAILGLLVVALSLLPVLLSDFPLLEPLRWRALSLLLAVIWPLGWFFSARGLWRAGASVRLRRFPFSLAVNALGISLLLSNVFAPSPTSPARYVAAISCLLTIGGLQFVSAAFRLPDEPTR